MVRFARVGLAAVPMCHPSVIRSRQRMRRHGGDTVKYQDNRQGLRPLPLKSIECGKVESTPPGCLVICPLYPLSSKTPSITYQSAA
jgi:hypothetical protein